MKIVVLERDSVGLDIDVTCLEKYGDVTYYATTKPKEVAERIKEADIVVANKAPLNKDTLKDGKNIKLICEFATGFDNVDIAYCKDRGIKVCNVMNYSTQAVAQHTFAMALYLVENLAYYDDYVKSGKYGAQSFFSNFDKPFTELAGKIWGIIGMGNIGRCTAKIAEGFGCKVIFYSVTGNSTCTEYERVDFDTLLAQSDFISVHCPLSDLTRNLIDLDAMKKMRKTAILINVARGPVVNNADLYEALTEGYIAAAGLDVLEKEPITVDNPLNNMKDSGKLIITPHIGWASKEARQRVVSGVCLNIEAFLEGKDRNVVNG